MFGRRSAKRIESISTDASDSIVEPEGISLEDLSHAYAAVLRPAKNDATTDESATKSQIHSGTSVHEADKFSTSLSPPTSGEFDGVPVTAETILEAVMFVGARDGKSLPARQLQSLLGIEDANDLATLIARLNDSYRQLQRAFEIVADQNGYAMRLVGESEWVRDQFFGRQKPIQLSQSAIDCLSLVAYQPGISKSELESQWNQGAGTVLGSLVRRGLIRVEQSIVAEGSVKKRDSLYYTTDKFLEISGLESLDDLPRGDDL